MEIEPEAKRQRVNLNQGMRRLAIFAGVFGAVGGGFYAHKDLRNVPSERYQHQVFEKLAASDVVKREQSRLLSTRVNAATFDWPIVSRLGNQVDYNAIAKKYGGTGSQEVKDLPPGAVVEPLNQPSDVKPPKGFTLKPPPATLPSNFNGWDKTRQENQESGTQGVRGVPPGLVAEPIEAAPSSGQTLTSSGIKNVFWKPDYSVDFFEMQDGGIVESGPSPSVWSYLLWVVFPALGFVIVWGAIRGIEWVGAGFFQT